MAYENLWFPSPEEAVNEYYAVYNETIQHGGIYEGQGFNPANISVEDKMRAIRDDFVALIRKFINFERGKEETLIQQFINKYGKLDNDFKSLLTQCLKNNDFTKAFNYIHIYQINLKMGLDKLPYKIDELSDFMESYMNIYIKKTAEEAVNSIPNIGNCTPEYISKYMLNYLRTHYQGDPKYKRYFNDYMNTFSNELLPLLKDNKKFGKTNWTTPTINIVIDNKHFTSNKSILDTYVPAIIDGLVNGLSQESFIVNLGGASTARAQRPLKYFTSNKIQSVPTETDAYLVLDLNLQPDTSINQQIKTLTTDKDIRQLINSTPQDDFVIHYSSKDSSIGLDGHNSAGTKIGKIKGEGSLDSKIPTLQEISSNNGFNSENVNNMIFTIVNNGAELVNAGQGLEEIINAITMMVIGFMFEDADIQLENTLQKFNNNEIHLFFLTGRFAPISEILEQFILQVEKQLAKPVVKVTLKPASQKYTSDASDAQTRWSAVRAKTIKNTQMGIDLLNNLLLQLGI